MSLKIQLLETGNNWLRRVAPSDGNVKFLAHFEK